MTSTSIIWVFLTLFNGSIITQGFSNEESCLGHKQILDQQFHTFGTCINTYDPEHSFEHQRNPLLFGSNLTGTITLDNRGITLDRNELDR